MKSPGVKTPEPVKMLFAQALRRIAIGVVEHWTQVDVIQYVIVKDRERYVGIRKNRRRIGHDAVLKLLGHQSYKPR